MPLKNGGLNLRSFETFAKSLSAFWIKAIMKEYTEPPMWYQILRYYLSNIKIEISMIFKTGYRDISKIALRLQKQSNVWSKTFENLSEIIRLIEIDNLDPLSLPIFGGIFSDKVQNPSLSIFGTHANTNRKLIQSGYYIIANYVSPCSKYPDLLNCMKYKNINQIYTATNVQMSIISYMSITLSLAKLFHVILSDKATYLNLEFCPNVKKSCIVKYFAKNCKGSSHVHRLIRQDYIINNNVPTAPAYKTAQRDYGLNLNLQIWERNLHYTPKIIALPGTSAFYFKLLIRQNWTRKKASLIGQNNDLGMCNYCDEIDIISDLKHMFYGCCMAIKIWKIITKLFKKSINYNLDQSVEHLIFMQGNHPVNKHEKRLLQTCMRLHYTYFKKFH